MIISILNGIGVTKETYKVVEMRIREAPGPVAVDFWHLLPSCEWAGERIEYPLVRLVDLGDTQNVVNVGNEGESLRRHKVGSRISDACALDMSVQSLDLFGFISRSKAIAVNRHKGIEITLDCCVVRQSNDLLTTRCLR
jgi:hypothetical protein